MPNKVQSSVTSGLKDSTMPSGADSENTLVISGMSGTFPKATNVAELEKFLRGKEDLMSNFSEKWLKEYDNLPPRVGKLMNIEYFDAEFFDISPLEAESIELTCRMMMEKTYEAITDAGVNYLELKGKKIGVYLGACISDGQNVMCYSKPEVNGLGLTGTTLFYTANRISKWLGTTGPSFLVDTACSTSSSALYLAFQGIREGVCDAALVLSGNSINSIFNMITFNNLGVLSPNGITRAFDNAADGYVRSESVSAILIQKAEDARRVYAILVNTDVNCDGYKAEGITYPSGQLQGELMLKTYRDCNVDLLTVNYIEAHGTGTKAGDPVELNAVDKVFCTEGHKESVIVGSGKSHFGHTEPVSGLCSIIKSILSFENGVLYPNVNYNTPNIAVDGLLKGRLKVLTEVTPFTDDFIGVNSFGFGGANCHTLLHRNPKSKVQQGRPTDGISRLVFASGRTIDAVTKILDYVESIPLDAEFVYLLHCLHSRRIPKHNFFGYTILPLKYKRQSIKYYSHEEHPVWFVFSGLGSQWTEAGRSLMQFPAFSDAIEKCNRVLSPNGLDCTKIVGCSDEETYNNVLHYVVGLAAIQIGLVSLLSVLGIKPAGVVGHSLGDLACAYATGSLTLEETMKVAYYTGLACVKMSSLSGAIALVGASPQCTARLCPDGVEVIAINSENSCMIGGLSKQVEHAITLLQQKKIDTRRVKSGNVAFHVKRLVNVNPLLLKYLQEVIPFGRQRCDHWVSSSCPDDRKLISSHYFCDSLLKIVQYQRAACHIPESAITLEISPQSVLPGLNVCVCEDGKDVVHSLLDSLGKLYLMGVDMDLRVLYPAISLPVSRGTPLISPLIKWQHVQKWNTNIYDDWMQSTGHLKVVKIDFNHVDTKYMAGHVVGGRNLIPASKYLYEVWKTYAEMYQGTLSFSSVVLENVKLKRATYVPKTGSVSLSIFIHPGSGNFEVSEGNICIVTGNISLMKSSEKMVPAPGTVLCDLKDQCIMSQREIYKDLKLHGYDYTGMFRGLLSADSEGTCGEVEWNNNWVTFMDSMLHIMLVARPMYIACVPTGFDKIAVDVWTHYKSILEENERKFIRVCRDKKLDTVQAGGIVISGMRMNVISQRKQPGIPVLESHQFVPYMASPGCQVTFRQALTICIHTQLENYPKHKFSVIDMINWKPESRRELAAPFLTEIIGDCPVLKGDIKVIGDESDPQLEKLKHLVHVLPASTLPSEKYHMVVASGLLQSEEDLSAALKLLTDNGCIVSCERCGEDVGTTVQCLDLDVIVKLQVDGECVYMLQKKAEVKSSSMVVHITEKNYDWLPQLQSALQKVATDQEVIIVAQGEPFNGILGLYRTLNLEFPNICIRCVFIQDNNAPQFDLTLPLYCDQLKKGLAVNILQDMKWGSYRHLPLDRKCLKEVTHAYNVVTTIGDLSSYAWQAGPLQHMSSFQDTEDYKYVHVYYAALNFRDILLAMGRLMPVHPGNSILNFKGGFELCGRLSCGRRVFGIVPTNAVSNLAQVESDLLWEVPDDWTMEDAVTVPIVYVTVLYGLFVCCSNFKKGESILIHSGTGGVGQAAINVALYYGLTVYTTVGTKEKRNFIRKHFPQIPDENIGNSHDTSFEQMIMHRTNGRGVDLVLNSLVEEKLMASLRCLAVGGRFIEIGKMDLLNNNKIDLSLFKKQISYHGVMLDNVLYAAGHKYRHKIKELLEDGVKCGAIRPITRTVFNEAEVEQACRLMSAGKHIGKVLIKIRDEEDHKLAIPKLKKMLAVSQFHCNPDHSYVIIGGLGGFGLVLGNWLMSQGAHYLILSSRRGITSGYQTSRIGIWRRNGGKVRISTADLSTEDGTRQLLTEANSLAPVGGVFNLGVVLHDCLFMNQTVNTFAETATVKAVATKHLDKLTREMCPQLKYFVVFSSVSSGRGNVGQSNYSMANSVMEHICEARVRDGLPGLAIQWGAIGEVGVLAEMLEDSNVVDYCGLLLQSVSSCLSMLDILLNQPHPVVSSMLVAEKYSSSSTGIHDAVCSILGIRDITKVSPQATLPDLGMDSMSAVEIKQLFEREYELFLSAQEIRELTMKKLKELSVSTTEAVRSETTTVAQSPNRSQLLQMDQFLNGIHKYPSSSMPLGIVKSLTSPFADQVFLIPGIDGFASLLEECAASINATTHILQLAALPPGNEIDDWVKDFLPIIKTHLHPGDTFKIAGFSLGGILALEIAVCLEREGWRGRVVLIDSSPDYLTALLDNMLDNKNNLQAYFLVSLVLTLRARLDDEQNQLFMELRNMDSWDTRVSSAISKITDDPVKASYMSGLFSDAYKRLHSLTCYRWKHPSKISSSVQLLKAGRPLAIFQNEDYNLSKYCSTIEGIHVIDSDHKSIMQQPETCTYINKFFEFPLSN